MPYLYYSAITNNLLCFQREAVPWKLKYIVTAYYLLIFLLLSCVTYTYLYVLHAISQMNPIEPLMCKQNNNLPRDLGASEQEVCL